MSTNFNEIGKIIYLALSIVNTPLQEFHERTQIWNFSGMFDSIAHEWAQWTSEISSETRKDKFGIYKQVYRLFFSV